jgi:hypothetical protein
MRALLLLFLPACLIIGHPDVPQPAHNVAVAKLLVQSDEGLHQCTAWKAGPGVVVTAGHCCTFGTTFALQGARGHGLAVAPRMAGNWVEDGDETDKEIDACELVGVINGESLLLADSLPSLGEPVWSEGYPDGAHVLAQGLWSGIDKDDDGVVSSPAGPGASGEPVMNGAGRVVGMGFAIDTHVPGIIYVVPLAQLKQLLE